MRLLQNNLILTPHILIWFQKWRKFVMTFTQPLFQLIYRVFQTGLVELIYVGPLETGVLLFTITILRKSILHKIYQIMDIMELLMCETI